MFLVCRGCGDWSVERPVIDGRLVCQCGHRRAISLRPVFVITGASGTGKSTVGDELLGDLADPVVLDADILWAPEMNTPSDGYARLRSTWMRLVANVAQSGCSSLLIGSGVPEQFEARPERKYVGDMHWLALVCADEVLERRLRARPSWRGVTDDFVEAMHGFNDHLRARSDIAQVDTSVHGITETRDAVLSWINTIVTGTARADES